LRPNSSPLGLDGGGRDDEPGRVGEVRQEGRVGFVEGELDGQVVERLDALDRREEEGERERAGVVERVVLVEHALEGEDDGLGVELGAVVEGHPLAQAEGVDGAILGDLPLGGERGLDLEGAVGKADEAVVEVDRDAEVVGGGHRMRVERLGLGDLADDEDPGRRLGENRHVPQRDDNGEAGGGEAGCSHWDLSFGVA
jgi:hypothetical protein